LGRGLTAPAFYVSTIVHPCLL